MFFYSRRSLTLIELLIAIILLAVIILGVNSIDIFSRYHFISTDRRAKLQNDVSLCLEHITKSVSQAIGNEAVTAGSVVSVNGNKLSVFIDANGNGMVDTGDYWIGYKFNSGQHTLTYCSQCNNSACGSCVVSEDTLAKDITVFSPTTNNLSNGYIDVSITACFDPTGTRGSSDNPSVTMSTSLGLPSVASN
jgi:Tfp pilus assembly protein PilV